MQPLMPLYYPIHGMSADKQKMHAEKIQEDRLNLQQLQEMNQKQQQQQQHQNGQKVFRHWTISDYTAAYNNKTTTLSKVVDRVIREIEEMSKRNNNKSVITQMNLKEL